MEQAKIQNAQKCLYCGKYLLYGELTGTYTYEDMKDWLGHVECANLHLLGAIEERARDIILGEPYLTSNINIIEMSLSEVLSTVVYPSYITECDESDIPNTTAINKTTSELTKKSQIDIIDLTNSDESDNENDDKNNDENDDEMDIS